MTKGYSRGDPVCKLILLGNGSVGKSSIIGRFVDDGFAKQYKQTIGLDFFVKTIALPRDRRVVLEVWDIGGQNIRSKMLDKYVYGADIVFVCYDVTDPKSFADADDWVTLVTKARDETPSSPPTTTTKQVAMKHKHKQHVYLVGNKIDLVGLRAVGVAQHDEFVKTHHLAGAFLLSAHSGDNVLRTVHQIAAQAVGVQLSEFELQFLDKPVIAYALAPSAEDDPRTADADAIEQEDLKLEAHKNNRPPRRLPCKCTLM
ncbi:hypothetical protein DYB28_009562 [Aphanomyces astaci]|uniref:Uncharacterized protein n=1 Tax=Aphanomyces astaci TaxID=112090 RepID=A0A396ZU82_APHAT|nr:hypothetical protein AaE_006720 [Aphanomyces astaci]RHX97187.1 hypothetical protein DYB36_005805 [Aphanomyces astaci]RHY06450.1 hypothetical protein DYB25_003525 [Aphanomyces astaci]RHY54032.1 hypothetical protein DYB38_001473 [Aphanomyces astaci]RHY57637.1 hypothetical protein DYB34_001276 [Aphanomyces astaci]